MRRAVFLLTTAAALAAMLAFAGPALAQTTDAPPDTDRQTQLSGAEDSAGPAQTEPSGGAEDSAGAAQAQIPDDPPVTVLQTELSGEEEVPGPGDPDGSGSATVIVIPPDTICYVLTAEGIEPATAAHIHEGERGEAGPVVQGLEPPTQGASGGCTQADPALVSDLQENPDEYYVNVHNEEYPAGAIRGQL
jgi:CHRD domain-containing protein